MEVYCNMCGRIMIPDGEDNWKCKCGNTAENVLGDIFYEQSGEFYETVYDEPDEGCSACGNPDYPKCKDSCKLYLEET